MNEENAPKSKWYEGVTPYMWLVLLIASLGWIFDIFEGQIFVASMEEMTDDLLGGVSDGMKTFHGDVAFAVYLVGGAVGGVLFGAMSDRIGVVRGGAIVETLSAVGVTHAHLVRASAETLAEEEAA